jgi:hypothetical protein
MGTYAFKGCGAVDVVSLTTDDDASPCAVIPPEGHSSGLFGAKGEHNYLCGSGDWQAA